MQWSSGAIVLMVNLILDAHELLMVIVLLQDGSLSRHFLLVGGHQFSRAAVRKMSSEGREARKKHEGLRDKERKKRKETEEKIKACECGKKEIPSKVTCGFLDSIRATHTTFTLTFHSFSFFLLFLSSHSMPK